MAFAPREREKTECLPPVRVEPERRERYSEACDVWKVQAGGPSASFADFVRAALDQLSAEVLRPPARRG